MKSRHLILALLAMSKTALSSRKAEGYSESYDGDDDVINSFTLAYSAITLLISLFLKTWTSNAPTRRWSASSPRVAKREN